MAAPVSRGAPADRPIEEVPIRANVEADAVLK